MSNMVGFLYLLQEAIICWDDPIHDVGIQRSINSWHRTYFTFNLVSRLRTANLDQTKASIAPGLGSLRVARPKFRISNGNEREVNSKEIHLHLSIQITRIEHKELVVAAVSSDILFRLRGELVPRDITHSRMQTGANTYCIKVNAWQDSDIIS
jgi:hypothetical protein